MKSEIIILDIKQLTYFGIFVEFQGSAEYGIMNKNTCSSIQFTQQSQILNNSPERRIIGLYQSKGFAYIVHAQSLQL